MRGRDILFVSQAEYDATTEKDPDVVYMIVDDAVAAGLRRWGWVHHE